MLFLICLQFFLPHTFSKYISGLHGEVLLAQFLVLFFIFCSCPHSAFHSDECGPTPLSQVVIVLWPSGDKKKKVLWSRLSSWQCLPFSAWVTFHFSMIPLTQSWEDEKLPKRHACMLKKRSSCCLNLLFMLYIQYTEAKILCVKWHDSWGKAINMQHSQLIVLKYMVFQLIEYDKVSQGMIEGSGMRKGLHVSEPGKETPM